MTREEAITKHKGVFVKYMTSKEAGTKHNGYIYNIHIEEYILK